MQQTGIKQTEISLEKQLILLTQLSKYSKDNFSKHILKKLPKLIMFEHIFSFLTIDEINVFAISCRSLKSIIHSSFGFKLIYTSKTNEKMGIVKTQIIDKINITLNEIKVTGKNQNDHEIKKAILNEQINFDKEILGDLNQQLTLQNKTFNKNVQIYEKKNKNLNEEIEKLKEENLHLIDENLELKINVKDINLRYKVILNKRENELDEKNRNIETLLGQRKILAVEVVKLQELIEKIELEKMKYCEALIAIQDVVG